MVKSKLLFGALVVGLSSNCYALLTDSPPDPTWANIDNSGSPLWVTYTFSGSAVYDPEGGKVMIIVTVLVVLVLQLKLHPAGRNMLQVFVILQ